MNKMSNKDRHEMVEDKIRDETIDEIDRGTMKWITILLGTPEEQMKRSGVIVGTDEIDLD